MTDLWLRWTPGDSPLREQAAALAVARGRQVLLAKGAGQCGADEAEGRAWRAVLAAVGERREDVVEITAALAPDDPVEEEPVAGSGGASPPQRARVDRVFFETCLDNDAIHPVIAADPELAGEILFAILAPRIPRGGFGLPGDELGINRLPGWFIPLYTRGPFLAFLRAAPAEAKRLVLRVVDAAAERWVQTRSVPIPEFEVLLADGCSRRLRGDEQVMQWYRGGSSVPSPLASALMALEKWLYDEADAGTDLAPIVGELFANTTSVAIVGLLIALACRDPRLLADPLRPLLSIPELCVWDSRSKLRQPQHLLIGLFREPAEFQRLAEEWFTLDHRRVTLEQRTQQMMLTDPAVAGYLQDQLPMWRARLDPDGEPATLRFLIARLDPSNWKQRTNDRGERYWECEPPEELRAESESTAAELAERRFWMVFPGQCRQILDGELELSEGQLEEFGRRSPAGSQIHRPRTSSPTA
jgi:hypothetical protein